MAKKYYAIRKGRDCSNVILETWAECLACVKGVKGAVYKSFPSKEEAMDYLNADGSLKKGEDEYPEDIPHIYVDGSYNVATGEYGFGAVVLDRNVIVYLDSGKGYSEECNQRQVNGELDAAIKGISFAVSKDYKKVVLFYDYAGVCNHATGSWNRNTDLSAWYYENVNKIKSEGNLEIIFVKVDSHTGDLYNDMADELAKSGAGVNIDGVIDKKVAKTNIKVASKELKEQLSVIIKNNQDNIVIADTAGTVEVTAEPQNDLGLILSTIKDMDDTEMEQFIKNLSDDIKCKIIHMFFKEYKK